MGITWLPGDPLDNAMGMRSIIAWVATGSLCRQHLAIQLTHYLLPLTSMLASVSKVIPVYACLCRFLL